MRARRLGLAALALVACGETEVAAPRAGGEPEALCPAFCTVFLRQCQHIVPTYATAADCARDCAAIPARGALGDTEGNSVACRLTFLMAATQAQPILCTYAQLTGSPACH